MEVNEQIRRAGAECYGIDPQSLKSLEGQDGAVYACLTGNRACVIKFVPTPEDKIPIFVERLAFMQFLGEHGVPVSLPVESIHQNSYESLKIDDSTYLVTLHPLAEGRHPEPENLKDWNERLFTTWGKVMGRMHFAARSYPKWEKPRLNSSPQPTTLLQDWREEHQDFVNWCKDPKILGKWIPLAKELGKLPCDRAGFGLIHNDLHPRNIFYNPDAQDVHPITIIDFDVCGYHWFINDIAIAVYHAALESGNKTLAERQVFARYFLEQFMTGYRTENDLDEGWFEYLPIFLKYREILLYIALTESWLETQRRPWQKRMLSEKKDRTLRDEPII